MQWNLYYFFWKHPGALGSHLKILGAHVDRTQCRRGCPSSLGTRHTEALTPHARTHTHSRLSTHGKIPRRVTLECGISGLHTWSAHHPSYDSVPIATIIENHKKSLSQCTILILQISMLWVLFHQDILQNQVACRIPGEAFILIILLYSINKSY